MAGTSVSASAFALDPASATTLTITNSFGRSLPRNGSLSISRGRAYARGAIASAFVETFGFGDIVKGSVNHNSVHAAVSVGTGVIIAITTPGT
jgi:hypothetical protein